MPLNIAKGASFAASTASEAATSVAITSVTTLANALIIVTTATDDNGAQIHAAPTATGLTFARVGAGDVGIASAIRTSVWRAYTTSAFSGTITAHWNEANDGASSCVSYTNTAGTSGNNGSDAIGNNATTTATADNVTVTVTSSSHDKSFYVGCGAIGHSSSIAITAGTGMTEDQEVWDTVWAKTYLETITTAVTPAANQAVAASSTGTAQNWAWLAFEVLAGASPATTPFLFQPMDSQVYL